MGILTVIFAMSIILMLIIFICLLVGIPSNKTVRTVGYIITLPVFFGAMVLLTTIGEIERLNKEKLDKYEKVTQTFYRKIK
jgi:hypothetical protein